MTRILGQDLPFINYPEGSSAPQVLTMDAAPDGDASPWAEAPIGSVQYRKVSSLHIQEWRKVKDEDLDSDWRVVYGCISSGVIAFDDFTDGGAALGTYEMADTIPAGAVVDFSTGNVVTAAEGESTLTVQLGDGSDADRYSTGTPSAAAAGVINMGIPSGVRHHTAAITGPVVTLTEDDDYTDLTAGEWQFSIVYHT